MFLNPRLLWKVVFVCLELPFVLLCYQFGVKRKAVGIWGCKDCGKVKAGGAYTMKYVSIASSF
jgi:ribosomal protein L37AE/L43A